jgi:hypothetical protein
MFNLPHNRRTATLASVPFDVGRALPAFKGMPVENGQAHETVPENQP